MSVRTQAELSITLESPFLSKGIGAPAFGLDACLATDHEGRAIIPGDQVKGLLSAALEDMAASGVKDATLIRERLFGRKSETGLEPRRGRALFMDLTSAAPIRSPVGTPLHHHPPTDAEKKSPVGALTRVAIDETTGAVRTGHLQVIEMPWPIGTPVEMTGSVVLFAENEDQANRDLEVLRAALALLPAVGAQRSLGFGTVQAATLKAPDGPTALPNVEVPNAGKGARVRLILKADRPVLVDAQRVADNVFQGSTVIPGAVLKGALATRLERGGALDNKTAEALTRLVINHAHPRAALLDEAGKPTADLAPVRPIPFSVITDRNPGSGALTVGDALRVLDCGVFASGRAPLFGVDWKDSVRKAVKDRLFNQGSLGVRYDTRTHTRMDNATYTSAEDQLFTWSAVVPTLSDGTDLTWQVDLVAAEAKDQPTLAALVERLAAEGLEGVGKTEATLSVFEAPTWMDTPAPTPIKQEQADLWAVTLLTPAVQTPLDAVREHGDDIRAVYADYWSKASGGSLDMVNVFAAQRLAGGYQALRYRLGRTDYDPYLLTEPGSVFLLKGDGRTLIETWLSSNLPLPPALDGATWETFPFMPEGGYGAIACSVIDHMDLAADLEGASHAW